MAETLEQFEEEQQEQQKPEEEQTQPLPSAGKEDVKEDDTSGGKDDRPEKNYEKEIKRLKSKHEDEMAALRDEVNSTPKQPTGQPFTQQQGQGDWWNQVYQMAENEMTNTGRTVPIQTITQLANSIAQRNYETNVTTRDGSAKTIRSFKRQMRKEPDYKHIEDDLDELIDQLKPGQVNKATLEVCLNSVRGKRLPEVIKAAEERGRQMAEKDTEIVGPTTEGTTHAAPGAIDLTSAQQVELDRLNADSEIKRTPREYMDILKSKRARFKEMGARNEPHLLDDKPVM